MPAIASLAFATRRVVNVLSGYVLLAFPSGRLGSRRHRLLMAYAIALTAIQVPPRLLLVDRIPGVARQVDRITTLGCDCVNPFVLVSAPGLFSRIESVTAFLTTVGVVAILGLVILRLIEATAPMRRVLWPVLFGALVSLLVFAFNVVVSHLGHAIEVTGALAWIVPSAGRRCRSGFSWACSGCGWARPRSAIWWSGCMVTERRPRSSTRSARPFTTRR